MKKIFISILGVIFFVLINGCSSNSEPQFRIRNEQLNKVNMNIQTSGSNKFNINDIGPGQTTAYQTTSEGNITVTAIIQNESVSFMAAKNTSYTIVVGAGKPISVHVDK